MHYVLVDQSVPFDGFTAAHRPLGGAEKGFASLAVALRKRGHAVTVLNRCTYATVADGVDYRPLDDIPHRPVDADVVIASRQPKLLGAVRKARHRLLWVVAAPDYLTAAANSALWDSFRPAILFVSRAQQQAYAGSLPHHVLAPGVNAAFHVPAADNGAGGADAPPRVVPPHAVVTTHPLHGLEWIVEIWRRLVHPYLPEARLVIYSALLAKGLRDDDIDPAIMPVLERVKTATNCNVVVAEPLGDSGMAAVYRASRLHFYPGNRHDFACWTLAESQAAGTPAVARNIGSVAEHVVNGQTGFLVPDAAAFGNVALELLRNDDVYGSFSTAAADAARIRTWDMAAAELEALVEQRVSQGH